jgi:D-arabinose 5-phosphate isomerase GutQ
MPKISIFAGVAALFLIGVGTCGSTVDPLAMMMSATGLTYFVVSLGIAKIGAKWESVS